MRKQIMIKKEYIAQMMLIIGIITVILILLSGVYILLSPSLSYLPKYFRSVFAVVIISYGFYRSVNIFNKFKYKEVKQ